MRIRKSRQLFIAIICTMVLLVVASMIVYFRNTHHSQKHALNDIHEKNQTAIKKSVGYILNSPKSIQPYQWLIVDYLQRKYGLDDRITPDFELSSIQSQEVPDDFGVYMRIIQPEKLVTSLPQNHTSPLETMMMDAMYCDKIPLQNNYQMLIQENIDAGGYRLTHVGFVLQRLVENGCHPFNDGTIQDLKQETVDALAKITSQETNELDLKYEAAAFLFGMGVRDKVPDTTIQQIANSQLTDGSWSGVNGGANSDDHTTVLALWALLAYENPQLHSEPMIRHSNRSDSSNSLIKTGNSY